MRDDLQDVALQDENSASLQRERRLRGFPVFIFFVYSSRSSISGSRSTR